MGKRRSSRKAALQFLYQADSASGGGLPPADLRSGFESFRSAHHADADRAVLEFAFALCRGVSENVDRIDGTINGCCEHWKVPRMSMVDRNVLRIAVYEMVFLSDIPLPVTINEAIEVAKEFGSETSGAFVNGVLDEIAREVDKGGPGDDS